MRKFAPYPLSLALCCAPACKAQPPASPQPISIESPSPSASASAAGPEPPPSVVGGWQAQPCDSRKYVRNLGFESDGTFAATDLVAPCPPGAKCVWSGIILWRGTWKLQDARVLLSPDPSGRLPDNVPASLVVHSARLLSEAGDPSCRYAPAR